MKISYNWLKQFLQTDWNPEKTGELLTDLGLEVEGIDKVESITNGTIAPTINPVLTPKNNTTTTNTMAKVCNTF